MKKSTLPLVGTLLIFTAVFPISLKKSDVLPPNNSRFGKDFVVFFVIDDYEELEDIDHIYDYSQELSNVLAGTYGFLPEIIRNPSKEKINTVISQYNTQFQKGMLPADGQLLFFLLGHSYYSQEKESIYFIPQDGLKSDRQKKSYIAYSELQQDVAEINCDHILFTVDAQIKGATTDIKDLLSIPVVPPMTKRVFDSSSLAEHLHPKSRLSLFAGNHDPEKEAFEFTKQFLNAINFLKTLDDGIITFFELITFFEQGTTATKSGIFEGHEKNGDFFLVPKQNYDEEDEYVWYRMPYPHFIDKRDWNEYRTFDDEKSGLIWMAEDLKFKTKNYECYNERDPNCNLYGHMYTLDDLKNPKRSPCPNGWHVPTEEEWDQLAINLGGYFDEIEQTNYGDPKKGYHSILKTGSFNLGGVKDQDATFLYEGIKGYYWSSTADQTLSDKYTIGYYLDKNKEKLVKNGFHNNISAYCRCVKDP